MTKFAGMLVMIVLSLTGALAADVTGKWSGTFVDGDSGKESSIYAVLKQSGTTLTGSAGPSDAHQLPILTGKIEGDHLIFSVQMSGGTIHFDLTNDGGELKGKMQVSEDGHTAHATVTFKRVP